MPRLEFGWYLSTHGDTTAYSLPEAQGWARRNSANLLNSCWLDPPEGLHFGRLRGGTLSADQAADAANSRGRLAV